MLSMLRNAVVFLWLSAVSGSAQSIPHDDTYSTSRTTQTPSVTSSAPVWTSVGLLSLNSTGTCPSRTVNFITHTLAQQCLRTDRASSSATQSALPDVTDNTGAFATTITSDQQPQVVIVTYTVANGSTIAIAEHGGSAREQVSTQSSSIPAASPVTDSPAAPAPSIEEEVDSALDNANFLSFEDWKRQNLAKSGQNPEDVGRSQNNGPPRPRPPRMPDRTNSATETAPSDNPTSLRSKDAGKTCKERTNYASFDCAATVLKSNKEAKSVTSVLIESKDSYMLNKCSAENKFFIVELCNDIQIDTVVLANYEFFSSGFRHFKLSVSDRYPVKMEKWRDLGTFEARNTREIQAFLVENPQIWARYLRIEFLTHYGSEYYCPVSLLRVHGITMMEDYRHQEELASGEIDDVALEAEALATPPIYQEPAELTDETSKATEQAVPPVVEVEREAASADANTIEETASGMTNSTRTAASSSSSPPPPQPSTQESFFKSVHKRLQQLESNSTLSLQYIEEQSRILREAFSKVEKRQVSTTSRFLTQLNETVMVELQGFRQAYDQLWQSTVIELEGQRETYQREMLALSSRLTMVADELVWQKRVGIVQSTLLLMCLVLVLFGRS
ncbi:Sad1_UNC-domain-containing protein, partial [Sphaerulina musiva SO2202]